MKINALIFVYNDFKRAVFTLENFSKHNPDIPVRVINDGGEDPTKYISHISNIEIIQSKSIWHSKTHCGKGSFGPEYYDFLFDMGLNNKYSHTLFLETDVLTNRKITVTPNYDISGVMNKCGAEEDYLYDYLELNCERLHTGCGGTIFSKRYFEVISKNGFELFREYFNKFPLNYYSDMISSLVARKCGLSIGHWKEVTNNPAHFVNGELVRMNPNATMIHNYKV